MLTRQRTAPMPNVLTSSSDCFPITFAERGATVTLVEIRAGERVRKRLNALGLHPGMRVRLVQDDHSGPVILAVQNDARLAIGRSMAQKMMVRHYQGET